MKRYCVRFLIPLLLSACATTLPPPLSESRSEKVFDKNYVPGRESQAYVGDPVVKLKDYVLTTTKSAALTPTTRFQVSHGSFHGEFVPEQPYAILVNVEYEGERLQLVPFAQSGGGQYVFAIAVRADGTLSKSVYARTPANIWGPSSLTETKYAPESPRMEVAVKKTVDQQAFFENFELIYNGTDGRSIFITYREFTADNLARPAFFQNLTYDVKSEFIRFKKYKIKLIEANAEHIKTIVLEDGR